jgi:hypothetical protein
MHGWFKIMRTRRSAPVTPLTIFHCQGIPALRRERIESAAVAGARHRADVYEGAIDPFHGDVRMIITGPHGFERRVAFAIDEESFEITRRVRETIDDEF